jgi:HEPN pEK499 p136
MLTLVDVAIKSFEQQIRATKVGKIPTRSCWRDLQRSIIRLEEKLDATHAMQDGFQLFRKSAEKFISELETNPTSQEAEAAFSTALLRLAQLRQRLEHATMPYTDRNETLGFAERTRTNLRLAMEQAKHGDMHVVTELTLSLLGLVIFPVERHLEEISAQEVVAGNPHWPQWHVTLGEEYSRTLADLSKRVRNAAAHRRIMFSSDSRDLAEVFVEMEDYLAKQPVPFWRADIRADHLHRFCDQFAKYIDGIIG